MRKTRKCENAVKMAFCWKKTDIPVKCDDIPVKCDS